jgi:hypothetical protein
MECPNCGRPVHSQKTDETGLIFFCDACDWGKNRLAERQGPRFGSSVVSRTITVGLGLTVATVLGVTGGFLISKSHLVAIIVWGAVAGISVEALRWAFPRRALLLCLANATVLHLSLGYFMIRDSAWEYWTRPPFEYVDRSGLFGPLLFGWLVQAGLATFRTWKEDA